ncbi:MAG: LLM class F420-dependent oxidoreductase [Mycobacterium sp.]|uniref:LLM class F420-dependent oxidoreductase n=1 Tax=Mycobacterium sp. TaxID=1785 RepID=UPI003F9B2277
MNGRVEAVLPFWLDQPDEEALDIAQTARDVGLDALWIGEMVTYDAFALATAIGHRVPGLPLRVGPLAVGVRSPVTLALGVSSVASLTGQAVDIALGASSPVIVAGWHDREWAHAAPRVRETIECLRSLFDGDRIDYDGNQVRSHGFRLRRPRPGTRIAVGAFGPAITRVAARHADEVVLNLVPSQRVAQVRATIDAEAAKVGRTPPSLTVWVPAAFEPGNAALRQLAAQLAVYLAPPGYGEMFCELGYGDLVRRARAGAGRLELADHIPADLLGQICLAGSTERIAETLRAYHEAGADCVAVVPSTAEDPGGRAVLAAVAEARIQSKL